MVTNRISCSLIAHTAAEIRKAHGGAVDALISLKGALQLQVFALSKFALLRYLSEIRFQVLTAIYPRFTHESGTIRKKQAIDVSKLKRLLCYESQHQSQSNEKSLVQFDYEKAVSNYFGTQSTFNGLTHSQTVYIQRGHEHTRRRS